MQTGNTRAGADPLPGLGTSGSQSKQAGASSNWQPGQSQKKAAPARTVVEEELPIADIDTRNFDYQTTDLNKLTDAEIRAHKKAMDEKYNKNFVGKADPNFQYDTRKDFKAMRAQALANADSDDDWD